MLDRKSGCRQAGCKQEVGSVWADETNDRQAEKASTGWIKFLVGLVLLLSGGLCYKAYDFSQQDKKEAAAQIAKVAAEKKEVSQLAALKAAMFGPQDTREKPMVKIAVGTSGQADPAGEHCDMPGGGHWEITPLVGGAPVGMAGTPNGWSASSDGTVTVPSGTMPGNYQLYIETSEPCDALPGAVTYLYYEFEVVCMKVTLSLTP